MLPKTTKPVQSPRKLFDGQHFEVRAYFSWEEEGGPEHSPQSHVCAQPNKT